MSTPEEEFQARLQAERAANEARGIRDVPFDKGPGPAAQQLWDNVTGGTVNGEKRGVAGLISRDQPILPKNLAEVTDYWGLTKPDGGGGSSGSSGGHGELGDHIDPGEPGDHSSHNSDNSIMLDEMDFRRPAVSPGAKAFFEREGYSTAPVGGPELYDKAFVQDPAASDDAQRSLAKVHGERSQALADFYKQQTERDTQAAAVAKQKAMEDQANIEARQRKLDEATQFYTNDLQDQGKFWTNPGNIVSAIAFSLMPIFSNDPAIGAKLINQAIDRDMANRQHAANSTLGALQSNLSGYHKIAGDRQAGDLLAQAEAHRIAAQEIARIGQQFESPISQKQMQVNIADQMQRRDVARMEFFKQNLHINASKMDPGLHAARAQGPGGYQEGIAPLGGIPQRSPIETQGAPGTAVTGALPGKGGATTSASGSGGALSPTVRAVVNAGGMRGVLKASNQGLVNDSNVRDAVKAGMYAEGHALYPNEPPDQAFVKILHQTDEQLKPFSVEIAKNAASRRTISALQGKMAIIERLERGEGRDPNEFVSWSRKNMPGSWVNQYDQLLGKDPAQAANKAEERAALRANAVRDFEAQFQNALNSNMHDLNGGAVSASEQERTEKEVSAAKNWRQQKAFIDRKALALQAFIDDNKAGLTPAGVMLYRIRSKGGEIANGLPRRGQPLPPAPPQPGYQGGQSGASLNSSRSSSNFASQPDPTADPNFIGPR